MKEALTHTAQSAADYTAGKSLWEMTRLARFDVDDPDGNFIQARLALEGGRSLLLYVNHISKWDPVLIARFTDRYITPIRNTSGIAGLKHYDPQRAESSKFTRGATKAIQDHTGLGVILVVQDYDKDQYKEPSPSTGNRTVEQFNSKAYIQAAKTLRTPGQILFVAPEGTRSPTGALQEAENGLDILFSLSKGNALAMPVAIETEDGVPIKIGPLKNAVLRPGELFSLEDLDQDQMDNPDINRTDLMMIRLASLLSPANQGEYRKYLE